MKDSSTKTLTCLYVSTVVVVSLLAIGGQVLTQRSLLTQAKDATVINIAGRQRMLSQKITKVAYALRNAASSNAPLNDASLSNEALSKISSNQATNTPLPGGFQLASEAPNTKPEKEELAAALALFEKAHLGLQKGSTELNLPGDNSAAVAALFAAIKPQHEAIVAAGTLLVSPFQEDNSEAIEIISANEGAFLKGMNAIVVQYEQEAQAHVAHLQGFQRILLGLTLLTLLPVLVPIYQVTRRVNTMVATMQRAGLQVSSASVQIAASGRQLESMATEQAASSSQISASSQEIVVLASKLNQQGAKVVIQAQQAQEIATTGGHELSAMAVTLGQLDQMTNQLNERFGLIRDRAHNINQVVFAMTKVADQTNLLSLNAAIEAEKAGESGAGFAVVAREIRRLADQSAIATLEIEGLVQEMQTSVAVGISEMEKVTQQVADSSSSATFIQEKVTAIIQTVQRLLPPLSQMNEGMAAQVLSAQQIREAIAQLTVGSEETVRSLQETNGALEVLHQTAMGLEG